MSKILVRDLKIDNIKINFPNLFKVNTYNGKLQGEGKYSADFLLCKTENKEDIIKLKNIIKELSEHIRIDIDNINGTLKDCDVLVKIAKEEGKNFDDRQLNHFKITAKNKQQPIVIDKNKDVIDDENLIKSFDTVNIFISLSTYEYLGKKGITVYLNVVQLVKSNDKRKSIVDSQFKTINSEFVDNLDEDMFEDMSK